MQLLDLPHEPLSYIAHFADPDTLRVLCLTEKRDRYHIACRFIGGTSLSFLTSARILNTTSFPSIPSA